MASDWLAAVLPANQMPGFWLGWYKHSLVPISTSGWLAYPNIRANHLVTSEFGFARFDSMMLKTVLTRPPGFKICMECVTNVWSCCWFYSKEVVPLNRNRIENWMKNCVTHIYIYIYIYIYSYSPLPYDAKLSWIYNVHSKPRPID